MANAEYDTLSINHQAFALATHMAKTSLVNQMIDGTACYYCERVIEDPDPSPHHNQRFHWSTPISCTCCQHVYHSGCIPPYYIRSFRDSVTYAPLHELINRLSSSCGSLIQMRSTNASGNKSEPSDIKKKVGRNLGKKYKVKHRQIKEPDVQVKPIQRKKRKSDESSINENDSAMEMGVAVTSSQGSAVDGPVSVKTEDDVTSESIGVKSKRQSSIVKNRSSPHIEASSSIHQRTAMDAEDNKSAQDGTVDPSVEDDNPEDDDSTQSPFTCEMCMTCNSCGVSVHWLDLVWGTYDRRILSLCIECNLYMLTRHFCGCCLKTIPHHLMSKKKLSQYNAHKARLETLGVHPSASSMAQEENPIIMEDLTAMDTNTNPDGSTNPPSNHDQSLSTDAATGNPPNGSTASSSSMSMDTSSDSECPIVANAYIKCHQCHNFTHTACEKFTPTDIESIIQGTHPTLSTGYLCCHCRNKILRPFYQTLVT